MVIKSLFKSMKKKNIPFNSPKSSMFEGYKISTFLFPSLFSKNNIDKFYTLKYAFYVHILKAKHMLERLNDGPKPTWAMDWASHTWMMGQSENLQSHLFNLGSIITKNFILVLKLLNS